MAYGYYFDQVPYLLATYADAVYMHPMGQAMLPGISSFNLYFKELIENAITNQDATTNYSQCLYEQISYEIDADKEDFYWHLPH